MRAVLIQAVLDAPMFVTRWRWNATRVAGHAAHRAAASKVAPAAAAHGRGGSGRPVFPDQLACVENLRGEREIPDHPLVRQTISRLPASRPWTSRGWSGCCAVWNPVQLPHGRDLTQPSPLSLEIMTARPYAYLDDAPIEERRTQAV